MPGKRGKIGCWRRGRPNRHRRRCRTGRHHDDAIELRAVRDRCDPGRGHVAAERSQERCRALAPPARRVNSRVSRSAWHALRVHDLRLADAGPLGQDLADGRVLGDQRHAPVGDRQLDVGRGGRGRQQPDADAPDAPDRSRYASGYAASQCTRPRTDRPRPAAPVRVRRPRLEGLISSGSSRSPG